MRRSGHRQVVAQGGRRPWQFRLSRLAEAVLSVGAELIHDPWTAYAYGHARGATLAKFVAAVSGARPLKTVQVADGQRRFRGIASLKAVYATGWDGDLLISGEPNRRPQISTARRGLPA